MPRGAGRRFVTSYDQYRSFNHIYELRTKPNRATFEVFDLKNQSVFKKVFQNQTKESEVARQAFLPFQRSAREFGKKLESLPEQYKVEPLFSSEGALEFCKKVVPYLLEPLIKEKKNTR